MTKLEVKISDRDMHSAPVTTSSNRRTVLIHRKDKKIQVSFSISYLRPDLSDVLLAIRMILLDIDLSFEEYCKLNRANPVDPACKREYRQKVGTANRLSRMFTDIISWNKLLTVSLSLQ